MKVSSVFAYFTESTGRFLLLLCYTKFVRFVGESSTGREKGKMKGSHVRTVFDENFVANIVLKCIPVSVCLLSSVECLYNMLFFLQHVQI